MLNGVLHTHCIICRFPGDVQRQRGFVDPEVGWKFVLPSLLSCVH
jgi:hypothetical protein